jgi:hypothetical protein
MELMSFCGTPVESVKLNEAERLDFVILFDS